MVCVWVGVVGFVVCVFFCGFVYVFVVWLGFMLCLRPSIDLVFLILVDCVFCNLLILRVFVWVIVIAELMLIVVVGGLLCY